MCLFLWVWLSLSLCMYVHYMCAWCLWKQERTIGFPGTGVTESCGPPYGCWALTLGLPQEQQVILALSHLSSPETNLPINHIWIRRYKTFLSVCTWFTSFAVIHAASNERTSLSFWLRRIPSHICIVFYLLCSKQWLHLPHFAADANSAANDFQHRAYTDFFQPRTRIMVLRS